LPPDPGLGTSISSKQLDRHGAGVAVVYNVGHGPA
jgi:hypothetical protein